MHQSRGVRPERQAPKRLTYLLYGARGRVVQRIALPQSRLVPHVGDDDATHLLSPRERSLSSVSTGGIRYPLRDASTICHSSSYLLRMSPCPCPPVPDLSIRSST